MTRGNGERAPAWVGILITPNIERHEVRETFANHFPLQ